MADGHRPVPGFLRRVESWAATASLLLLGVLPILEIVVRLAVRGGIPGYNAYLFHLVLMAAFLGGMITAREGRHLAIRVAVEAMPKGVRAFADTLNAFLSTTLGFAFFWASLSFVAVGFEPGARVGFLPIHVFVAIMPLGFLVMTIRFMLRTPKTTLARIVGFAGILTGTFLGFSLDRGHGLSLLPTIPPVIDTIVNLWYTVVPVVAVPLIVLLVIAAFSGVPLFIVLGGAALLLFAQWAGNARRRAERRLRHAHREHDPGDPALHARRLLSQREQGRRTARASLSSAVRLDARWTRDRGGAREYVLHDLHRRLRCDDSRARRAVALRPRPEWKP